MEYRQLGNSGLKVPVLSFGTATFAAGSREGSWGNTQAQEATRLVDIASSMGSTSSTPPTSTPMVEPRKSWGRPSLVAVTRF